MTISETLETRLTNETLEGKNEIKELARNSFNWRRWDAGAVYPLIAGVLARRYR